jgi:F0F1-type ATP synthase assembly protein I
MKKVEMIKANRKAGLIVCFIIVASIGVGVLYGINTDRIIESIIFALITGSVTTLLLFYGTGRAFIKK